MVMGSVEFAKLWFISVAEDGLKAIVICPPKIESTAVDSKLHA